jgi:hypothetical protein
MSALFLSSITQENMVATSKFTRLEEAWNNLYAGYIHGVASTLVLSPSLEDEQRLSVGVLLMAVKCKINAINSCINTQRMITSSSGMSDY